MDYLSELEQQNRLPSPGSTYGKNGGDGIIYVGGGKYWVMIVTGIKMLRDTGCKLPVEVWYRGSCEPVIASEVDGLNVTLIDSDEVSSRYDNNRVPKGNTGTGGWEAKLYAIYHSNFDRAMFLDADAYCVSNPEPLFSLLECNPFVYWKDFDNQRNSIKWDAVYPAGRYVDGLYPVQGGQFLFDKIKLWKVIHLANWMCQHSDYYFKLMFGDQDTWRVAFAISGETVPPIEHARWVEGIAFVCYYNSKPYVVHRCQGKMFLPEHIPTGKVKFSNPQYRLPSECRAYDLFAETINARKRDSTNVFTEVYSRKLWGNGSGVGSQLKESQLYIDVVNNMLRMNKWKRIVDLGCGDGFVSSFIEAEHYTGYDCVEHMIKLCKSRYGGLRRTYNYLDILTQSDIIDSGDVLLCKDVLHHLPNERIVTLVESLLKSKKWKAIVCTQDCSQIHDKQDTYIGGYRALSPTMYPLNMWKWDSTVTVHHKKLCCMLL